MTRKLILCLFVLLLASAVSAQEATPEPTAEVTEAVSTTLSYGTPAAGTITDTAYSQDWTLRTASPDRIRVEVVRTDGNLVPNVLILDANGSELTQSYGADSTYARAVIENFSLPAAGEFTIRVERDGGETGLTSGDYTVTVTPLGTGEDNPNNQTVIGEVLADVAVSGEITPARWLHRYTYVTPAADTIRVIAERTSGTLMPEVAILDVNGAELRRGYNDAGTADTSSVTLPNAGTYTILVTRERGRDGDSVGVYDLTVELLGAGEGSPSLTTVTGDVVYDTPITGTITGAQWYQDYQLVTDAGDTIQIDVERTGGNLIPEVVLLGGSGQELRRGYTEVEATASIDYTLENAGTYTVRVTRQQDQTGETTGEYALTVSLAGSGEGSPELAEVRGSLPLNEPVSGEITNAQWAEVWTFAGSQDTAYDITVTRTDGTFVPMLETRDINNQVLRTQYPDQTYDRAALEGYTLPGSGEFRVVVYRERGQEGVTTGEYELIVTPSGE